jgi:CheY-like chemotaxis protein
VAVTKMSIFNNNSGNKAEVSTLSCTKRFKTTYPVLLVEDKHPNILVASYFLENWDLEFQVATDGLEAVEKAKAIRFSLILMDIQMEPMDGLQAAQAIREHEDCLGVDRVPIIGVSAHTMIETRTTCLAAGMDDYLPKPFNGVEFRKALERHLA